MTDAPSTAPQNDSRMAGHGTDLTDGAAADAGVYGNAVLLAGRSRGAYLQLPVLLLAASADVGAFLQVIELVMRRQSQRVVLMVVVGFTATVLCLAHLAGSFLRGRAVGERSGRHLAAWTCLAVWVGLGLVAFWVRLVVRSEPLTGAVPDFSADALPATAAEPDLSSVLPSAALFLALYLATGVVAAVGGYLTSNPVRVAYVRALRAYRRATEQAAASAGAYTGAAAYQRMQLVAGQNAATARDVEQQRRRAFAEDLKQYARVLVAQRAQDPAVTDALFDRPGGQPSPNGSRFTGQAPTTTSPIPGARS